jgi:hypothetical protein
MRDWLHASKKEINNMTVDEAIEIIQKHIDLGHTKGDFRPREHMTKAMEIILDLAKSTIK